MQHLFFRKKVEEAVDGTMGIIKPGVLSYFDSVVSVKSRLIILIGELFYSLNG